MARLSMRMAPAGRGEDVLQDALSAAWLHWAQYDAGRGTPRNWLLAIVANEGRPARRREHSPDLALSQVSAPQPTDRAATPIDVPVGVDLARALARLTDRQRLCVELYYFLGLPVADVAVVMSCSAGTAKSTLADARLKLRGYLGEDYR
ncbi:MAG: polymerase sigma-70 factor, subfamily [Frankiales bacterium]|nr:polymerase sigma-70 factor, subfamily [Frankiales bacterium]